MMIQSPNQETRHKELVMGVASLNLAEYASMPNCTDHQIHVPLNVLPAPEDAQPSLLICLSLVELKLPSRSVQTWLESVSGSPSPKRSVQKEDNASFRTGLKRNKKSRTHQNGSHEDEGFDDGVRVAHSNERQISTCETDSTDDGDGKLVTGKRVSKYRQEMNYKPLAHANNCGESLSFSKTCSSEEDWIHYKDASRVAEFQPVLRDDHSPSSDHSLKSRILPWTKRRFSFRSNKAKEKGEPLLKKDCLEDGGDDIDYDRRMLSSCDESSFGWGKSEEGSITSKSSFSEFGDNFAVGSWELKEIASRDGNMKLNVQVFSASIDQRNERAAGESACTALVAVIANWLHSNHYEIPIKSEFDSLIRDGSLEWRNLCEIEEYMQRFPDKHFDLETVIQAGIRSLSLAPEKSFIGFFHPEGLEGEDFDFLNGAMSFDNIWEQISNSEMGASSDNGERVYIVSWNDHFFVLMVEQKAFYIIDTLGERLYEGCSHAYVLKFDQETVIKKMQVKEVSEETPVKEKQGKAEEVTNGSELPKIEAEASPKEEEIVVCKGKETCKEYIKSFLAAIPLRELQNDVKKGLKSLTPLHQRLQIEFHYTKLMMEAEGSLPPLAA